MEKYKFVNVRFNLENEEESKVYFKLNEKNRGGHVKKELKKTLLQEAFEKSNIESLVRDMVINMGMPLDTKDDKNKKENISSSETGGIKIVIGNNKSGGL